jgi:hypothetical protein
MDTEYQGYRVMKIQNNRDIYLNSRDREFQRDRIAEIKISGIKCLALYCYVYFENIGFVYPAMSMIVIGPSLLY